jgi:hypothetical protein
MNKLLINFKILPETLYRCSETAIWMKMLMTASNKQAWHHYNNVQEQHNYLL